MFGKNVKTMLSRTLRTSECSQEFSLLNFLGVNLHQRKRSYLSQIHHYTRRLFILVMGYTGKEAAKFKEMYIAEFNRMRKQLTKPPQTQLEILQASIGQLVEQERRLTAVENGWTIQRSFYL
ncbi:Rha family transcriptional regulator [Paenibacillus larvae]|nr:Rha family transcriptional regulator [Paenibacillus larvae]MDT2237472.1 Rha family transcriptional regulator [Paenibacillus larvae]